MKNLKLLMLTLFTWIAAATGAFAQESGGVDDAVNAAFSSATGWFVSFIFSPLPGTNFPWIVLWLVVGATVFTLYFGFILFIV